MGGATVRFTDDSIWITLLEPKPAETQPPSEPTVQPTPGPSMGDNTVSPDEPSRKGVHLQIKFQDANSTPTLEGFSPSTTVYTFMYGEDQKNWQTDVPVWEGIRYKDLYPGVDLEIASTAGQWSWVLNLVDKEKYSKVNESISFSFSIDGQDQLSVDDETILIGTQAGSISIPLIGVHTENDFNEGSFSYSLAGNTISITENIPPADKPGNPSEILQTELSSESNQESLLLTTESTSPFYSTFLGGSGGEISRGISVDDDGNAYVVGQTYSTNFPVTYGSFQGGDSDMFVSKLNEDGSDVYYSTFIGGTGTDCHWDCVIEVDANNVAYVTSTTTSTDFPTTTNAYDRTFNGGSDVYVLSLSSAGTSLLYSTYLGGSIYEYSHGIDLEGGYVYITGMTDSTNFPTTAGAYNQTKNPNQDIFITKLNLSLSGAASVVYSTFVGGNYNDQGHDIDILNGYAYVTGETLSTNLPTVNAFDTTYNGGWDSYVLKLNSQGSGLSFLTYLGGSSDDCEVSGENRECTIAVDQSGYAYVTGITLSSNFPTYHALDSLQSGTDAYLTKLNQSGNALIYSTYLGGSNSEMSNAIDVDTDGNVYVLGRTWSSNYPTTVHAFDRTMTSEDVFITKITPDGFHIGYSTFFGGSSDECATDIFIDRSSSDVIDAYFTGDTHSSDFPLSTTAYDFLFSGSTEAFVAKIRFNYPVPDSSVMTGCTSKNGGLECPEIATYNGSQGSAGDPINTRTGSFDYSVIDLSFPTSGGILKFQRYYSSFSTEIFTDTLGYGWTHNLDSYLIFPDDPFGQEGKVIYKSPSGNFYDFLDNGDDTYTPVNGVLGNLEKILGSPTYYELIDTAQNVLTFDADGKLLSREDPVGNSLNYIYTSGRLTRVEDDASTRYLEMDYYSSGRLESVTDHTNRSVLFEYDVAGDLTTFTDTLVQTTTYTYDGEHRLRLVSDPAGVEVVHTEYDSEGRAYQQFDPDGTEIVTIDYGVNGTTTITNSLSMADTHYYDDGNSLAKISEDTEIDLERSYDDNFRMTTIRDQNNHPITMTWSANGANLLQVVDANQNQTDLIYDEFNNLTSIIDPNDYLTTYEYSGTLLIRSTDALSETTIYTYTTAADYPSPVGLLKAIEDPSGNLTQYEYDAYGQMISATSPSNRVTEYEYDDLGRLITVVGPTGQADWTCYDEAGRTIRTVMNATGDGSLPASDPCDAGNYLPSTEPGYDRISSIIYDDSGLVIATIAPNGVVTRTYFNDDNRPVTMIVNLAGQAIDNPTPPVYDPDDPNQNIRTDTYYDSEGNVIVVEDTLGHVTRTYYDSENRPQVVVQNLVGQDIEESTSPDYDPENPDQNVKTETVYDPVGNVIATIDTLGRITRTYYDVLNRPQYSVQNLVGQDISVATPPTYNSTYPDQNIRIEYVYDKNGNTIAVIDTLGHIQRTYFDALNRPQTVVQNLDGQGIEVSTPPTYNPLYPDRNLLTDYVYDPSGNQIAVVDPAGMITRTYYENNRVIAVVENLYDWEIENPIPPTFDPDYPDQNVRTDTVYDDEGRVIGTIDTLGRATRMYYDDLYRPYIVVRNLVPADFESEPPPYDPDYPDRNVRMETVYDAEGRTIAGIGNDGIITRTYYDILGRAYVTVQNLYGQDIDAETPPAYDPDFPDRNVRSETVYGPGGQVQKTIGPTGQVTYSCYDGLYRVVKAILNPSVTDPCDTYTPSAQSDRDVVTQNTFDGLGNVLANLNPNGDETTYVYDSLNRLVSQTDPLFHTTSFTFDGIGNQVKMTAANEVVTRYEYDAVGRLTAVVENYIQGQSSTTYRNVRTEYTYDAVGNRTTIKDAKNHYTSFEYDELNRLVSESDALAHQTTYGYDGLGNRISLLDANGDSTGYSYDGLNRLVEIDYPAPQPDVAYSYDASGNQITMTDGMGVTTWAYDDLSRPITVTDPFSGTVTYEYRCNGKSRDENGETGWAC